MAACTQRAGTITPVNSSVVVSGGVGVSVSVGEGEGAKAGVEDGVPGGAGGLTVDGTGAAGEEGERVGESDGAGAGDGAAGWQALTTSSPAMTAAAMIRGELSGLIGLA